MQVVLPGQQWEINGGGVTVDHGLPTDENLTAALVLAGGRPPETSWLRQVAAMLPPHRVYCADKGLDAAYEADLHPNVLVGDGDSARPDLWEHCLQEGTTTVHQLPRDKDETDLQALLGMLPSAHWVLVSGIWGGRFDHLLSAVYACANVAFQRKLLVLLSDEQETGVVMLPGMTVQVKLERAPLALSLLPLSDTAQITLKGVRWELEQAQLRQRELYTISNEAVASKPVTCKCIDGLAMLYVKN